MILLFFFELLDLRNCKKDGMLAVFRSFAKNNGKKRPAESPLHLYTRTLQVAIAANLQRLFLCVTSGCRSMNFQRLLSVMKTRKPKWLYKENSVNRKQPYICSDKIPATIRFLKTHIVYVAILLPG